VSNLRLASILVLCAVMSTAPLRARQSADAGAAASPRQSNSAAPPARACERTNRIVQYSRDGARSPTFIAPGGYCQVELSPDDTRLLVERRDLGGVNLPYDLWVADLISGALTRWTSASLNTRDPVWSPNSHSVIFRIGLFPSPPGQPRELRRISVGSSTETPVSTSAQLRFPDDWTPDGKSLLYHTDDPDTVGLLPLDGPQRVQVLLDAPGRRNNLRISPDGRWIAYGSNESGTWEIYVAMFPSFGGKRQISRGGAVQVRWRRDGRELYYLSNDSRMTAQAFDPGSGREVGTPLVLFQTAASPSSNVYFYSVTGKGDRFFVNEPERLPSN
jgi:eukaryotic-like serine/threonine-protein kinase